MRQRVCVLVSILKVDSPLCAVAVRELPWPPHAVFVQHMHAAAHARDALLAPPRHVRLPGARVLRRPPALRPALRPSRCRAGRHARHCRPPAPLLSRAGAKPDQVRGAIMLVFGARSAAPWARRGAALAAGARAVRRMSSAGAGKSSRLSKFHTLDIPGRVAKLEQAGFLTPETRAALRGEGLALEDANNMIENVLATFGVPMVSRRGWSPRDGPMCVWPPVATSRHRAALLARLGRGWAWR